MSGSWRLGWIVLCVCALAGCSGGSTSEPAPQAKGPSDPAAQSAYQFFDAVLKGDTQRASNQLTPLAMQRIIERGEQFAPPGEDDTVSFRIGQVVRPYENSALVQCIVTEASADQQPQDTEVYCLLRLVDGRWRVSGIAREVGPDATAMIFNFETGEDTPAPGATPSQTPPHVATRPAPAGNGQAPAATR